MSEENKYGFGYYYRDRDIGKIIDEQIQFHEERAKDHVWQGFQNPEKREEWEKSAQGHITSRDALRKLEEKIRDLPQRVEPLPEPDK